MGSNHIRYVTPDLVVRLTTDASLTAILQEIPFFLESEITLLLGPEETVPGAVGKVAQHFLDETTCYWRDWVRNLGITFEWQGEVIRAAITLKLNTYDDTGAITAPENASDSERHTRYS